MIRLATLVPDNLWHNVLCENNMAFAAFVRVMFWVFVHSSINRLFICCNAWLWREWVKNSGVLTWRTDRPPIQNRDASRQATITLLPLIHRLATPCAKRAVQEIITHLLLCFAVWCCYWLWLRGRAVISFAIFFPFPSFCFMWTRERSTRIGYWYDILLRIMWKVHPKQLIVVSTKKNQINL